MRALSIFAILALAAGAAGAQESLLPPEVLLRSRIKRHVKEQLAHLPAYTCLETVQRYTNQAGKAKALAPLDTIRLEILYTGSKELYASPGAHNFSDEHPSAYTAGGLMADGIFASHLQSIFISESALFTYRGEDTVGQDRGWEHAVRYDYRISRMMSGWQINVGSTGGVVGSRGSFWLDPEKPELLKVEIHADEIPDNLPVKEVVLNLTYGRMRIGSDDIMLPQSADMRMVLTGGSESLNQFEFTHCRAYQSESSISFETADTPIAKPDAGAAAPAPRPAAAATPEILPPGLIVPVTLTTPVAGDAAVGSLLEGRVSADVAVKGKVAIPQGAVIRGRIRRLERYTDEGVYFIVGLEFTEVEGAGRIMRFYADLQNAIGVPGLEFVLSSGETRRAPLGEERISQTLRLPDLPGVGLFFVRGAKFSLPAGFQMVWKTRGL